MRNLLTSVLAALFLSTSVLAIEADDQSIDQKGVRKDEAKATTQLITVTDAEKGLLYVYAADNVDKVVFDKKHETLSKEEKKKIFMRDDVQKAIAGTRLMEVSIPTNGDTNEVQSMPACRWGGWCGGWRRGCWGGCGYAGYAYVAPVVTTYYYPSYITYGGYNWGYGWGGYYGGGYYGGYNGCGYYGGYWG